jgi:hypothetical protein
MEPPTLIALVSRGIVFFVSAAIIVSRIRQFRTLRTPKETPKTGHDRAAQREEQWYGLDKPMIIDRNPSKTPLR